MKSRRFKPFQGRAILKLFEARVHSPSLIQNLLLHIPYTLFYGNNVYYSDRSTQKLASYTKKSR